MLLIIGGALLAAVTDCRRQMASDCLSRPAARAPTTLPVDESVGRSKSLVDRVWRVEMIAARSRAVYIWMVHVVGRGRPRGAPLEKTESKCCK